MTETTRTTGTTGTARRRWRRRLLLLGLLPLLLALAFAAKVAVMLVHDDAGRTAYAAEGYADARGSFAANATLNHLEPWVSPYDEGTARYRLGDFAGAVGAFTTALATVPPEEECRVRINLGLAHESVGDAAVAGGDREAARRSWRAGARALADGGCLELTPAQEDQEAEEAEDAAGSEADDADDARQAEADARRRARQAERRDRVRDATTVDRRLRDKLSQQPPEAPTPESDDPEARQQARQDAARLEQRNEQAQEERREQQQRRQDREAEEQRQQEEQEQQPGTGDGEGEPLTYEW